MADPLTGTSVKDIGARIVATRKAMNLNAITFARLCEITPQALANYEAGIRRPDIDQAGKLSAATGAGLDWFYHGKRDRLPSELQLLIFDRAARRERSE